MSRAPFGRRPPYPARRRAAVQLNWQPCVGGCGAETLDGRACGLCVQVMPADARCQCKHPASEHSAGFCNQRLGGGFRCNCRGFLPVPTNLQEK